METNDWFVIVEGVEVAGPMSWDEADERRQDEREHCAINAAIRLDYRG